jgi:hypothetical protein
MTFTGSCPIVHFVGVFYVLFLTCFVHNVSAIGSSDRKVLLDIRTAITRLKLDEDLFFS